MLILPFFSFAGDGIDKVFPVPQKESETLITAWLEQRGFSVNRNRLEMGQVELDGVKGDGRWRILVKPHSSLAVQVRAEYTVNGESNPEPVRELYAHLFGNFQAPSIESNPGSSQFVPTEILMWIESVVCVHANLKKKNIQFSGFIVDREGLILCTAHDLEGIREMIVSLNDGREFKARIIKKDTRRDLILLHIDVKLDTFIPLENGRNLIGMGEQLYTVGCPVNLLGTVHSGFVNGPPRRVGGLPLWQVDLDILPGSSGSPVFDIQGNLVGMVKGRYRGTKSVGFLIPIETIIAFVKEG